MEPNKKASKKEKKPQIVKVTLREKNNTTYHSPWLQTIQQSESNQNT